MYVIRNLLRYGINPKERYMLRVMPYAYGNYILAHARLHTNPSDWIEKSKSKDLLFSWSRIRESNPPFRLGKLVFYR